MKKNVAQETPGFGARIRTLRHAVELSVAAFASEIGCHRSYIYRLESGTSASPSQEFITKLVARFGANEAWLLMGAGQMSHSTVKVSQETDPAHVERMTDISLGKLLSEMDTSELRESLAHFMRFEGEIDQGKVAPHSLICTEISLAILSELRQRARTKTL